ncbi:MAG: hypothetical protein JXB29_10970 [Sedimentisphaerales bacterium]|nr:hypothetical protein [Sedimentisphaerales bacterium]
MKRMVTNSTNSGAALLVVLLVIMAVTVLSLGFLSRSDVELSCGQNMLLKTQVDYLAESGLEHAKGLILNPQEIDDEYWNGQLGQQLVAGSDDYYDIGVTKLGERNYQISCNAYRKKGTETVGRSNLTAELRLDPCIALWTGQDTTFNSSVRIEGDIYCNGKLVNDGQVDGDVFANELAGDVAGQLENVDELSLDWPRVRATDFTWHYPVESISSSVISGITFGPYDPVRVCRRVGDLELAGGVEVNGMLIVEGNLRVSGTSNLIQAQKNLPVLLVTGDLEVASGGHLQLFGLAVVDGHVQISSDSADLNAIGALFANDEIVEFTSDDSGNGITAKLHNNPIWQYSGGKVGGALQFDGVDDYAQTSDSSDKLQLTGDYTLGVWIKADPSQKIWAGIFSKCDSSSSQNHWTLQFDSSSSRKLVIHHPNSMWDTGISLSSVRDNWHNIRIVRSGNTMTSYLDGNPIRTDTWDEGPGSGTGHLNIGAERTASPSYLYKGLIDEILVYDRAPDVNETYPSSDPIAYYKLDDGGSNMMITADPSRTAVIVWSDGGIEQKWGQAAGAFFRSIERQW